MEQLISMKDHSDLVLLPTTWDGRLQGLVKFGLWGSCI